MEGGNSIPSGRIISCLIACKMISKRFLCHIVTVQDLDSEIPPIESVPVVREFRKVFPNDIPVFLFNGKLNFVDLLPDTSHI